MTISNVANKYLKLTSEAITNFIANIGQYQKVKIMGTYNCIVPTQVEKTVDAFASNSWKFDLTDEVLSAESITKLILVNNLTGREFNAIGTPINLLYIRDNCTTTLCTIQDFTSYYTPLFKDTIDDIFASVGISSNVTVDITNNNVYINDLPSGFSLKEVSFESSAPPAPALYSNVNSETDAFFIGLDGIYVKPSMFDQLLLVDGIYTLELKLLKASGFVLEKNCFFVDILTKCRVAAYLVNLLDETISNEEQTSTSVHWLHYGLTNGNNCGCNCSEMCTIYIELDKILTSFKSTIDTDCGC